MLIINVVPMEPAMYFFVAEFQKTPNYMNTEGETCSFKNK